MLGSSHVSPPISSAALLPSHGWQQSVAVMTLAPMSQTECLSVDASAAACLRRRDGAASVREVRAGTLAKRSTWTRLLSTLLGG
jgi:hypothetical protein